VLWQQLSRPTAAAAVAAGRLAAAASSADHRRTAVQSTLAATYKPSPLRKTVTMQVAASAVQIFEISNRIE